MLINYNHASCRLCNNVILMNLAPSCPQWLGAALTFFSYFVFAVIGLILVAWLLPETKGKSLEELETMFGTKASTGSPA